MKGYIRLYQLLFAAALLHMAVSDYACLCNYNVELYVYKSPSASSTEIGYMYEFDCKPLVTDAKIAGWVTIAFEKKMGYIEDNPNVDVQMCVGGIPKEDKIEVQSTFPTTTTNVTSALPSTTLEYTTIVTHPDNESSTQVSTSSLRTSTTGTSAANATTMLHVNTTSVPSTASTTPLTTRQTSPSAITTTPLTSTTTTTTPTTTSPTTPPTSPTTTSHMTSPTSPSKTTTSHMTPSTSPMTSPTSPMTLPTSPKTSPTSQMTSPTSPMTSPPSTKTATPSRITSTTSPITSPTSLTTAKSPMTSSTSPMSTHTSTMPSTAASTTMTTRDSTGLSSSSSITTATSPINDTKVCPPRVVQSAKETGSNLTQYKSNCYEVSQEWTSWPAAESHCNLNGGHLVHIANQNEQDFIYKFLVTIKSHTVWIGFHDRLNESNFEWTSGSPVTYTNWSPDRTTYLANVEDCGYITHTGEWNDARCDTIGYHHGYICQYDTVSNVTGNIELCPSYVIHFANNENGTMAYFNNSCYALVTDVMSWQHADGLCHSRGGDLVTITSADEQHFIQTFLTAYSALNHRVWIGLNDIYKEGHFRWSSGSHEQYTNWAPDHVHNQRGEVYEDCGLIDISNGGLWDDYPCGQYNPQIDHDHGWQFPSLCQYKLSRVSG